ncbi:MAG: type II toxin-antitoxin system HicA family toxin [Dehalococcoidales bacterium]|jgi:predicted RNA binding protein YcfA (HicA-like mRNA interferase family)
MPKLPQISGSQLVKILQALGYSMVRQRGSHIRMRKITASGEHAITVPEHKVVAKGTLNDIVNKVSLWNNITKEDIIQRLKHS